MEKMQQHYDERLANVNEALVALRQGSRVQHAYDVAWRQARRGAQQNMKDLLIFREQQIAAVEDALALCAQALSQAYPDLQDLVMNWTDDAELALAASAKRKQEAEEREEARVASASSQVRSNQYAMGADARYRQWFAEASGRPAHLGPVGASGKVEPQLSRGWRFMTDHALAVEWLQRGGYASSEQTDENGWTALHHAMQTTVYWDLGHRVCRGLIEMMQPVWLRAKTWGGWPAGYSALHLCCNGGDCANQRASLAALLIARHANPDALDDEGRTPFLLAAGTGVIDVAQALSTAGCDLWALSHDGRNAGDRCKGSSGSMRRCAL